MSDSTNPLPVLERTLRVIHAAGIHVRPATRIAAVASSWDGEVRARCGNEEADARDRLDLLMLAAGPGAEVTFRAIGQGADRVLDALEQLFARRFE